MDEQIEEQKEKLKLMEAAIKRQKIEMIKYKLSKLNEIATDSQKLGEQAFFGTKEYQQFLLNEEETEILLDILKNMRDNSVFKIGGEIYPSDSVDAEIEYSWSDVVVINLGNTQVGIYDHDDHEVNGPCNNKKVFAYQKEPCDHEWDDLQDELSQIVDFKVKEKDDSSERLLEGYRTLGVFDLSRLDMPEPASKATAKAIDDLDKVATIGVIEQKQEILAQKRKTFEQEMNSIEQELQKRKEAFSGKESEEEVK